jgi:hypothetical protein
MSNGKYNWFDMSRLLLNIGLVEQGHDAESVTLSSSSPTQAIGCKTRNDNKGCVGDVSGTHGCIANEQVRGRKDEVTMNTLH